MQLTKWQRAGLNGAAVLRVKMAKTGYTPAGQRLWTPKEIQILRSRYPDYRAAQKALPQRTRKALEQKAQRLGIVRPLRAWSLPEVEFMRPRYRRGDPVSEIAPLVRKTKKQVWGKACKVHVRRPKKPPKQTGLPLVDAVRQRAFELNFSMRDLDEGVGSGVYFRSPRRVNKAAIQRAVEHLGGRFVVRWNDESQ